MQGIVNNTRDDKSILNLLLCTVGISLTALNANSVKSPMNIVVDYN